jgi:hypothetical protein
MYNQRSTPSKNKWHKLSSLNNTPPANDITDESKSTIFDTAQTLKSLSKDLRKISTTGQYNTDSIEQRSPPTVQSNRTVHDLQRQKSTLEQLSQRQRDRSNSSSRRLSITVNDDGNILSKAITPRAYDHTPSLQSRSLTRSNSINPINKDQEKSSSGERSYFNSAAQSRRVSMGLSRSPVRAEELEQLLTKVSCQINVLCH